MMRRALLLASSFLAAVLAASPASRPALAADPPPAAAAKPDFEAQYLEANGQRFHYVSQGDGPLVLFLHGFPAFWYMWRDQLTDIGRDHRAVAMDLRGYNLSSKPAELAAYEVPKLVEDVRAFVEKLNGKGKKFVLVGHDWGGLLAWCFALYHPEMLDKLVIINAPHPTLFERELRDNPIQRHGSEYTYAFNKYDGVIWEEQVAANNFAGLAKGILGTTLASGNYDQADVDKWIAAWKQPGALTGGLNWYRANHLNPPFNDRHPKDKVPTSWSAEAVLKGAKTRTVETPTLVIWGLADSALQAGNLSGMEKLVPNVRFRLYPGLDHWVPMVKAREVNQDIRTFLATK